MPANPSRPPLGADARWPRYERSRSALSLSTRDPWDLEEFVVAVVAVAAAELEPELERAAERTIDAVGVEVVAAAVAKSVTLYRTEPIGVASSDGSRSQRVGLGEVGDLAAMLTRAFEHEAIALTYGSATGVEEGSRAFGGDELAGVEVQTAAGR